MRWDYINYLIEKYNFTDYLEIGLNDPRMNFDKIKCQNKESVDPYGDYEFKDVSYNSDNLPEYIKNKLTYQMTSDELFTNMPRDKKYDIVFIDGLHEGTQVVKDFQNAVKHLRVDGFILMHDCLPTSESAAQFPRKSAGSWFGKQYQHLGMSVMTFM